MLQQTARIVTQGAEFQANQEQDKERPLMYRRPLRLQITLLNLGWACKEGQVQVAVKEYLFIRKNQVFLLPQSTIKSFTRDSNPLK